MIDSRFKKKLTLVLDRLIKNSILLEAEEIWLFGSVARGDCNADSDIDILVLTSGKPRDISLLVEKLDVRDDVYFPKVDVIVRTPEEIESDNYWFYHEVRKDKIVLWRKEG